MKKIKYLMITLTLASGLLLSACGSSVSAANQDIDGAGKTNSPILGSASAGSNAGSQNQNGSPQTGSEASADGLQSAAPLQQQAIVPVGELSEAEIAALNFMREEEKLAQDVYQYLFETWGQNSFQSISQSETAHTNSVLSVLNAYGLGDPSAGLAAGVYNDPDLQALYGALVERGITSLAEALKVSAEIEEIDILDLQIRLAETQNASIQQVYNNLLQGSYNHLRAFTRNLQAQTGEVYQPLHLSAEEYQSILSGSNNGGYGQGGQGQGGQGHGKGQGGQGQGGQGYQSTPVPQL